MVLHREHCFRNVKNNSSGLKMQRVLDNLEKTTHSKQINDFNDWRKVFDFLSWAVEKRKENEAAKHSYLKCLQ